MSAPRAVTATGYALALAALALVAACGAQGDSSGDVLDFAPASDGGARDAIARDASAVAIVDAAVDAHVAVDVDALDAALDAASEVVDAGGCPAGMVRIAGDLGAFCIDRWEAHVVEINDAGTETPHSPFSVVDGLRISARTAPGVPPQGYISQVQASAACAAAGKRLCAAAEFSLACRGPSSANHYPYGGTTHIAGDCNEGKGSSVARFFGTDSSKWTYAEFNDPKLNQWDGGLAPTGAYGKCESPFGVFDCVGNLHEWGSDPADSKGHGRFRGGFYGDAEINGPGCLYVTSAHGLTYHDYSTGFRCCKDAP